MKKQKDQLADKLVFTIGSVLLLLIVSFPSSLVFSASTSRTGREDPAKEAENLKKAHELFLGYYKKRQYGKAEEQVKKALDLARRLLGNRHLITATEAANLAALYVSTKRYEKAEPLFREALKIRRSLLPKNDARILRVLEGLQIALAKLGKSQDEKAVLLQMQPFYDGRPPRNSGQLAFVLNRLGVIHINAAELEKAEQAIRRSIDLYTDMHGRRHVDTIMAISNLAVIHTKRKNYNKAISLFDEVYETRRDLLGKDHPLTLVTMTEIADIADRLKQHERAMKLARVLVEYHEKRLGADHIDMAGKHNRLSAYAYRAGNFDLAGRELVRAIEITQKNRGADSPLLLVYLKNAATLFEDLGRYQDANSMYLRRLRILEKNQGKTSPDVITSLIHLGKLSRQMARYEEAEKLFKTALEREKSRPNPDKQRLGAANNNLAGLYRETGRYRQSAARYDAALALHLADKKARKQDLARIYDNIGVLNIDIHRYDLAETYHKKALAIFEEVLGPQHRSVSFALNNLATVYDYQGRNDEALRLRERSLAIYQKDARPADPMIGVLHDNLAGSYRKAGRLPEAEQQYEKAMKALLLARGPDHPEVALAMSNLAALYGTRGDFAGAERLYKRAIAINERAYGGDHPQLANIWALLGDNDLDRKNYDAAEKHYNKALKISVRTNGREHIKTGGVVARLARLHLWQQDYSRALSYFRRAARIQDLQLVKTRNDRRREGPGDSGDRGVFTGLAIAAWHVASNRSLLEKTGEKREALREEGLQAAQKALRTSAGAALVQMSARFAAGSGPLAQIVRQRQDLTARFEQLDKKLLALVGARSKNRNELAIRNLRVAIAALEGEIADIDSQLRLEFPQYASLANPRPMSSVQIRKHLKEDEALLFFMTSNQAVYVWVLTRQDIGWHRVSLKRSLLRRQVAYLRQALDPAAAPVLLPGSTDPAQSGQAGAATEKVKTTFDLDASYLLYKNLLQPFEKIVSGKKHLLVVATDALTALPFQVLVTAPPDKSGRGEAQVYRKAQWLIRRHALTTLPSIASLKALRQFARKGRRAPQALVAFGDPVFSKQQKTQVLAMNTRGFSRFYRGGRVSLAVLSQLAQLPDTRDELLNVAQSLGVAAGDLRLGRAASETAVKAMDKSGELARHRIVYFATHGLVSGDIEGLAEPALALSLPERATELDDGLLMASEVAQLHLNADWVVLSACNTASGGKPGAEALSGLARAFFYAGARSLLVSHWPVYSDAATLLTTQAFRILRREERAGRQMGRAEALRRSMLALINKKSDDFAANPSYWAPFVVVGEGAVANDG